MTAKQKAAQAQAKADNLSAPGRDKVDVAACLAYAQRIATQTYVDHYREAALRIDPKCHWKPYGDLWGVLEQIDNMLCAMVRATPEQISATASARSARFGQYVKPTPEDQILACVATTQPKP